MPNLLMHRFFRNRTTAILLGLLLFVASPLNAQTSPDSIKITLDPIQVTAIHSAISPADAPLSLGTYSRSLQTLNASSSLSLSSIGNKLPGLWVNDRQNYALGERLTIRGVGWRAAFGVRGIQVILNGIPLTVADGQSMINIIDPAFIRRAELIRGPASAFWGNSSGGVLYLSSRPHRIEEPFKVRLRSMIGSYGLKKGEAEVLFSTDKHQLAARTGYLESQGFRDYSGVNIWRSGVSGSLKLTSRSRLTYQAASVYMPKAQHPSSLTARDASQNPTMAIPSFVSSEAGKQTFQGQAGLQYLLDTGNGIFSLSGYGIYRDLENPLPFGIITVNRRAGGLRATYDKSWDHVDLQLGVESKLQDDDRREYENIGEARKGAVTVDQVEQVWNHALFATTTFTVGDFHLLGGLRYDRLSFSADNPSPDLLGKRTFQSISPSIGVNYRPSVHTIFANLSTSFEAPTTTELVNRPGGGNGFNPFLKPERTTGIEIGVRNKGAQSSLTYDITAYHLWIDNLLFPYQLEADGPTYYRNQGQTNHLGLEGSMDWRLNPEWSFSATANLSQAKFRETGTVDGRSLSGKDVPGMPNLRLYSQLKWTPGNVLSAVSYEYVSSYPVNNQNSASNDSYGIVDAKLGYTKTFSETGMGIQPFINLQNVFDIRYNSSVVVNAYGGRYYEPAPGRSWQLGASLSF